MLNKKKTRYSFEFFLYIMILGKVFNKNNTLEVIHGF